MKLLIIILISGMGLFSGAMIWVLVSALNRPAQVEGLPQQLNTEATQRRTLGYALAHVVQGSIPEKDKIQPQVAQRMERLQDLAEKKDSVLQKLKDLPPHATLAEKALLFRAAANGDPDPELAQIAAQILTTPDPDRKQDRQISEEEVELLRAAVETQMKGAGNVDTTFEVIVKGIAAYPDETSRLVIARSFLALYPNEAPKLNRELASSGIPFDVRGNTHEPTGN